MNCSMWIIALLFISAAAAAPAHAQSAPAGWEEVLDARQSATVAEIRPASIRRIDERTLSISVRMRASGRIQPESIMEIDCADRRYRIANLPFEDDAGVAPEDAWREIRADSPAAAIARRTCPMLSQPREK